MSRFQSSPARGGGCNRETRARVARELAFQSSPAPGGGCNEADEPEDINPFECFNPHPPLGAGATCGLDSPAKRCPCFNPHPPLGAGATGVSEADDISANTVSIRTRPQGRVQPLCTMLTTVMYHVN